MLEWVALLALWLAGGALMGALGRLAVPDARGWRAPLAVGMAGALAGGGFGTLLFGRVFGSPAAVLGAALALAAWWALAQRAHRAGRRKAH
jgi:hypothetical protein